VTMRLKRARGGGARPTTWGKRLSSIGPC